MGITIRADVLEERLEDAVRLAESASDLPAAWTKRTEHIAQSPSQTYVAALGVALLAKAADPRVDVLTIKATAGENAYSMRGVAKTLVGRARHFGYHLGVTSPEPLNNQPWFGNDRIDRIVRIRDSAVPFHEGLVRYLRDLNGLDADEALHALAAFLRSRLAVGREMATVRVTIENAGAALEEVLDLAEGFIRQNPEGGKRGQAVVAAIFDCISDEVQTGAINNPRAFDVRVDVSDEPILAIEVKQKPVGAEEVVYLAASAQEAGIDKSLYAALAVDQHPIDRSDVQGRAAELGVFAVVATSLHEVVEYALIGSALSAATLAEILPGKVSDRLDQLRASGEGIEHWSGLFLRA